jgi:hypothetical protein
MLTHIQVLQEEFWTKVGNFEMGFLVFFFFNILRNERKWYLFECQRNDL